MNTRSRTLNGLNIGDYHILKVMYKLYLNNDVGVAGQVLISGGEDGVVSWGTISVDSLLDNIVNTNDGVINDNIILLGDRVLSKNTQGKYTFTEPLIYFKPSTGMGSFPMITINQA